MSHISDSYTNGKLNNVCKQQTKRLGSQTIADWCIPRRKPLSPLDSSLKVEHRWPKLITWDDVVSQRLKFGSAFLSSSWESKIALFFLTFPYPVPVPRNCVDFYWPQRRSTCKSGWIAQADKTYCVSKGGKSKLTV